MATKSRLLLMLILLLMTGNALFSLLNRPNYLSALFNHLGWTWLYAAAYLGLAVLGGAALVAMLKSWIFSIRLVVLTFVFALAKSTCITIAVLLNKEFARVIYQVLLSEAGRIPDEFMVKLMFSPVVLLSMYGVTVLAYLLLLYLVYKVPSITR